MNSETPPENWICVDPAAVRQRIGAQKRCALRRSARRRASPRTACRPSSRPARRPCSSVSMPPACSSMPSFGAEAAAGLLDAHDPAVRLETDEPRADIERGEVDDLAVGADRDLGGAAADVDVHHPALVADRARHRARAVGRHHRLQAVAGADRDQPAGLPREQFADRARVAPLHRDAGQDQRAGVDLVRIDLGVGVLLAR